jgi:hypothetical protein
MGSDGVGRWSPREGAEMSDGINCVGGGRSAGGRRENIPRVLGFLDSGSLRNKYFSGGLLSTIARDFLTSLVTTYSLPGGDSRRRSMSEIVSTRGSDDDRYHRNYDN